MGRVRLHTFLGIAVLACLAGSPRAVDAGQKTRAARPGEEIVARTDSGGEIRGRLIELSPESLSILTVGGRMEVPIERLQRIDATHDSVANGAAIGGLSLGLWCAVMCGQGLDSEGSLPMAVVANAGLGALIGAAIDAAHKSRTPIYIRTGTRSGVTMQVTVRF